MVCRMQKEKMDMKEKIQILAQITGSKSVKKRSIILDAYNYINDLKLKLEAMNNQYLNLISHIDQLPLEVKVEKIDNKFLVKVDSKKRRDVLVPILEGFEEKGLNVIQVRVCNNNCFCMEAITETENVNLNVDEVKESVIKALVIP